MAVLMIGEVPALTEEIYMGMVAQMAPLMQAHKGFISHVAGPSPSGGFRVVEVWETEEDAQAWFDDNVKPSLPPDIVPTRTYSPLSNVVTS
jgi:heme-degrading monooxygenase HmoA